MIIYGVTKCLLQTIYYLAYTILHLLYQRNSFTSFTYNSKTLRYSLKNSLKTSNIKL
jgi:hypothetical protein